VEDELKDRVSYHLNIKLKPKGEQDLKARISDL